MACLMAEDLFDWDNSTYNGFYLFKSLVAISESNLSLIGSGSVLSFL